MPDWLTTSAMTDGPLPLQTLTIRLLYSFVLGLCVAGVFKLSHGRHQENSTVLATTLVLMSVLIAMVSMTIGNSVARAFSLVGALSIVRFRTVVDDTRDTAFVILSVIVGMAAGTGLMWLPLVGLPIVGLSAVAMSLLPGAAPRSIHGAPCRLTIRLALGRDPAQTLDHHLERALTGIQQVEIATVRQGSAMDLTYTGQLRPDATAAALVSELNHVEGVMSVELQLNR